MNQELAQKLKKAGFPQHEDPPVIIDEHCHDSHCHGGGCTKDFCVPTLEELISACGDRFYCLHKRPLILGFWEAESYKNWKNLDRRTGVIEGADAIGKTPSEAVANLWIELNKPTQ